MFKHNSDVKDDTLEDLLVIRSALDKVDIFHKYGTNYKSISKTFVYITMGGHLMITLLTVLGQQWPGGPWEAFTGNILTLASIFTGIMAGLQTYINPVGKWMAFRAAEILIKSEVWKFRARVDPYSSGQRGPNPSKRLKEFISEISNGCLSKAGITEIDQNINHSKQSTKHFQYKKKEDENYKFNPDIIQPVENEEDDFGLLSTTEFNIATSQKQTVDNQYSQIIPAEQITFRILTTINYFQNKMPQNSVKTKIFQFINIILSVSSLAMASFGLSLWLTFMTMILSQATQQKEFNGFDKKLVRSNQVVSNLNEKLLWWMSLNSTEKKNKNQMSRLVLETEALIIEESKQWSATSGATTGKDDKKNEDKDNQKIDSKK